MSWHLLPTGIYVRGGVEEASREFEKFTSRRPHVRWGVEEASRKFEELPMSQSGKHRFCFCKQNMFCLVKLRQILENEKKTLRNMCLLCFVMLCKWILDLWISVGQRQLSGVSSSQLSFCMSHSFSPHDVLSPCGVSTIKSWYSPYMCFSPCGVLTVKCWQPRVDISPCEVLTATN